MQPIVTRWDLDKTYLRSDFYTFRDLVRQAFERPDQKRSVPGASRLLAELGQIAERIHILSGSPEQMRKSLSERLSMDGVRFDELTLKPNLKNLVRLRLRSLKDQLGYKLPALLRVRSEEMRRRSADDTPPAEVLVGDDSEADAFVYSLYADIVGGRVDLPALERILIEGDLFADDRRRTLDVAARVSGSEPETRFVVLIHLDRQTPPSRFSHYGPRLVPFFNYAQAALVLLDRELVASSVVYRVSEELLSEHRFDVQALARSYWDLRRRGHVGGSLLGALQQGRANARSDAAELPEAILRDPLDAQPPAPSGAIAPVDYEELARQHRGGRNRL